MILVLTAVAALAMMLVLVMMMIQKLVAKVLIDGGDGIIAVL